MDINKYKKELLNEKEKIEKLIVEMQDNTMFGNTTKHSSERYTSGELSSYDNHSADMGTEVYMQDMQNSLTIHERGKLDNIENALYKIENGTYGVCEQCHKKIDEDRLDIVPETNLCAHCSKHQPDLPITSGKYNQNLINEGASFYDEILIQLNDINDVAKRYNNTSNRYNK
ncbi:TraR/DksA C4-type zinc finger protein [Clostridium sp. CCUG 7971]|uniref:TraR/DksA C4-type zinc finger protein n=1 Tax=Clostridium sp. CCUG 7971 TaxID=2811414 RepID=UPI001ABA888D|nr:TraR/DksA C4-type zinc finger protein [Clostridium sp. CCUG 7971]MBO3445340.1 TraR/DksA C4-type zinc finger protein [Clostridium sp. CCUG 7971]